MTKNVILDVISLLQSLWLGSYFVGSLTIRVLKPTERSNNILYI